MKMKRIYYILCVALLAAFGCQEDPLTEIPVANTLEVSSTIDVFGMEGGEDVISLTLNSEAREWALAELIYSSGDDDWCTPSVLAGKASSSIKITDRKSVV